MWIALSLLGILLLVGWGLATLWLHRVARQYRPGGQFMPRRGGQLHYLDLGPPSPVADPVILIHGASANALDKAEALGAALSAERRVIIPDRPGFGFSDRADGDYHLRAQADAVAALMDHLRIRTATIVAQSYGGAVALSLALHHPDRVKGLVLLAPVSHPWPGGVAWYNHLGLMPVVGHLFRHIAIPLYGKLMGPKIVAEAFWPKGPPTDYWDKAAMPLTFRPASFRANCEDIVHLETEITAQSAHYGDITCPVRIIWGSHDTVVLSTIHGRSLVRELPDASLTYVDHIGHPVHHFTGDDVARALAEIDLAGSLGRDNESRYVPAS